MADEKLKNDQVSQEVTDDKDKDVKGSKGGKLKFVLIPLIIIIQAVAAYFIVFNILLKQPKHQEKQKPKTENLEVGQFYELNDIVVNPAGSGGRRYLVVEMGLETADPLLVVEAKSKEIWVRDAVITLLTNKTSEELMEVLAMQKLKKEILDTINRKMMAGKFERIYFKKYIIQ